MNAESRNQLPLAGIRVLDMTHVGAGPFSSSILGQLGADVVKLESIQGDRMRRNTPTVGAGELGYYFASVNLQKRFLQMDLKKPEAQDLLRRVIPKIDVVVENFRPGVADRLGAGFDQLSQYNERLIYCSIKGFRAGSKYGDLGSIDYVHEAMTGIMAMTKQPGQNPPLPGYPAADFSGALYAALAVVVALRMRDLTGKAQFTEVPLQDSLLSLLPLRLGYTFATGLPFPAFGDRHRDFVPFGVYHTTDKSIIIAVATDNLWKRLVSVFPSLDRPEYQSAAQRLSAGRALDDELQALLAQMSSEQAVASIQGVGVPAAVIMETDEVYRDEYVQEMLTRLPVGGEEFRWIPYAARHNSFTPVANRAPDRAGAQTREILAELGVSADEIDSLFAAKAVAGN